MDVDAESPTVAVAVTYNVGSRNEVPGQSGFAHLFEHMMFQGSRHVPKGRHFQMIASRGGTLNGTTSTDRTNYFETMPSSELKLALWLEADRMRWLEVTDKNLENQRAVVKEEYRMRYENAPYRLAQIELDQHIFAGYPPYAHPTIGNLEDLDRARIDWVKDFHARYYVPGNAVLAIAGGFEPDEAMRWVHEYFDPVENRPTPAFSEPVTLPHSPSEMHLQLSDRNAKTQAVFFGWQIVPYRDNGHAALELLTRLLADGESSILYERLVRQLAWARNVSAFTYDHVGPDGLVVNIELTQGARFEQVESVVRDALASIAKIGPTSGQLNRAIQRSKSSLVFELQSNQRRATTFGEYEVVFGDARVLVSDLERELAVTPDQIRRVTSQYLTPATQTVVRVVPVDHSAISSSVKAKQ
jgi:predicted Zn-dependent peptidase